MCLLFTISDSRYFLGTVGLVNSLSHFGYDQPVTVLDTGLTSFQRESLASRCTFVEIDRSQAANPLWFKPFPNLVHPSGTVVIIDSDMVLTRPLDLVIDLARNGRICAYPDPLSDKWHQQWQEIFRLPCEPRHQTYINTGLVAFSTDYWPELLPRWWEACKSNWTRPTIYEGVSFDNPTYAGDQDALNALLMSRFPEDAVALLPMEEAPTYQAFRDVTIIDSQALKCTHRGHETQLLHGSGARKPWDKKSWLRHPPSPYARLLRRLLNGHASATVSVSKPDLPLLLKDSPRWRARGIDAFNDLVWGLARNPRIIPMARRIWSFLQPASQRMH